MRFDAQAGGRFDQLGELGDGFGSELPSFALEGVGRKNEGRRALLVHRLLDLRDGFDAVFLEVAEDSDERGAKLRPALLKVHPIDDVWSFVAQTHAPQLPELHRL